MIVTTAGRTNDVMKQLAKMVASELGLRYVERNKISIQNLLQAFEEDVLIIGRNRYELHMPHSGHPMFFHPNSSMFRIKRLLKGDRDPFLEACNLRRGDTMLDCTLGLGSDSIVASFIVGETGKVVGVEGSKYIAFLLKEGLKSWESGMKGIDMAMKRIHVYHSNHYDYLCSCETNSFDIVYFDPMFEVTINESNGLSGLKQLAITAPLSKRVINEAKRVAKRRVVLKDHWQSTSFRDFGFEVIRRKTSKFHFGYLPL